VSPEAYAAYLQAIRFRLLQPETPMPRWALSLRAILRSAGSDLDLFITQLPTGQRDMQERLRPLLPMPRMSAFALAAIINEGVRRMPPGQAFVNVGVWHGFSFLAGMAGNADRTCIGIDNFSEFGGPREAFLARFGAARSMRHSFHELDYREYFSRVHQGLIGFYIYDGAHAYDHQRRGLETAEPFLAPGCIVLVDDTNDDEPAQATRDFVAARPGAFRILFERRTAHNSHPTFWNGVMVLERTEAS
jgi:predicted O-methyltransferase YrrM